MQLAITCLHFGSTTTLRPFPVITLSRPTMLASLAANVIAWTHHSGPVANTVLVTASAPHFPYGWCSVKCSGVGFVLAGDK